jgi:hypothetical protein
MDYEPVFNPAFALKMREGLRFLAANASAISVFVSIFGSLAILFGQILFWLRYGEWFPLTPLDALIWLNLPVPHSSWGGIEKMIVWVLEWPLALFVFLLGVLICYLCYRMSRSD